MSSKDTKATTPKIKRNQQGDIISDRTPFDHVNYRWWDGTHVFQYLKQDDDYPHFRPYFEIHRFMDARLEESRKNPDFFEKILFEFIRTPENKDKWDDNIKEHNWWLHLYIQYFKEVFDEQSAQRGTMPQFKYWRIILPKNLYAEIESVIEEYGLSKIHDLIFEIIAVAQHIYTKEVHHYENSGYAKQIRNIDKETDIVAEVIHRLFDSKWHNGEPPKHPKLDYITFAFQDGTKRISDPWLISDIIGEYKKYLERELPLKNWKKELKRFHERYSDIKEKLQFRYEFAIALYNLFTKEGFIKVTTKQPYPNNVVNCITKILDFCLIPVTPKPASLFEDRSKIVRNWLRRNKLTEKLTYLPVIPSQERLPKYFEPDFLNISSPIKGADVITTAWYICERFDIPMEFAPDFAHIALCLKQVNFLIGHQLLLVPGSKSPSPFDQHNGLRTLVESLKGKKKITSLKFQIEGDEKEYQFTERLPIYLIEQAISKHYKMHEEDFEVDIIKGKVFQCQHPGHYHFSKENKFHLPAEQFAVRFVKSFHNYLLNELPPGEKDHYPSQKYFSIIAVMMQHSWFFNQVGDSEDLICEKIAHWFSLNVES